MGDDALAEKRVPAMPRPVDELIREDGMAGRALFVQTPDRRGGQDRVAPQHLQTADVRPVVELRRSVAVPAPVAREEGDRHTRELSREVRVGGIPEGGLDLLLPRAGQAVEVVETAAADETQASPLRRQARTPSVESRCFAIASRTSSASASA